MRPANRPRRSRPAHRPDALRPLRAHDAGVLRHAQRPCPPLSVPRRRRACRRRAVHRHRRRSRRPGRRRADPGGRLRTRRRGGHARRRSGRRGGRGFRRAVERELEEARYDASLAARRYEHVDPAKRHVARELEARWNAALERVVALERRVAQLASRRLPPRPRSTGTPCCGSPTTCRPPGMRRDGRSDQAAPHPAR